MTHRRSTALLGAACLACLLLVVLLRLESQPSSSAPQEAVRSFSSSLGSRSVLVIDCGSSGTRM